MTTRDERLRSITAELLAAIRGLEDIRRIGLGWQAEDELKQTYELIIRESRKRLERELRETGVEMNSHYAEILACLPLTMRRQIAADRSRRRANPREA